MMWRKFFQIISTNRDFIFNYCNDLSNSFHYICTHWYMHNLFENGTVAPNRRKIVLEQTYVNILDLL